jgi:hypothetical protein
MRGNTGGLTAQGGLNKKRGRNARFGLWRGGRSRSRSRLRDRSRGRSRGRNRRNRNWNGLKAHLHFRTPRIHPKLSRIHTKGLSSNAVKNLLRNWERKAGFKLRPVGRTRVVGETTNKTVLRIYIVSLVKETCFCFKPVV